MFKSIVVGFDGSKHSNRALQIGATLAAQEKADLGIIFIIDDAHMHIPDQMRKMGEIEHVIEPTSKIELNLANAPTTMINSLAQANADSMDAMFHYSDFLVEQAKKLARHYGAENIKTKVVTGNPAEAIVEFAQQRESDLIVTGSRGFGKLKSLLLGSTSNRVTQLAQCSCLTVK